MSTPAKLVFSAITSLDGYTTDEDGGIAWSAPSTEVLTYINDLERGFGTHLYGRKMYETMTYWETFDDATEDSPAVREFAGIWRAASKVVYSRTLGEVASRRTLIERDFDPAVVLRMKETAGHDMCVGGPDLAGQAMAAGLVDEIRLFVTPITVGTGKAALSERFRSGLELRGVDRFEDGVVHLHYSVTH